MKAHPRVLPLIAGVFAAIFATRDPIKPSAWAAQNLIVPDGPRAGGRWDPTLTPYIAPIIDELGPDGDHNFAAVRKSAQTGVTIAGIALIGSYIDQAPNRFGIALPTIDLVQEFNREKLGPVIEQTPALRRNVKAQTSRTATGSTTTSKKFAGGSLALINANSAPDLKMRTIKVGVGDEVDAWADSLGDEGDPLDLYRDRFISFHATGDWRLLVLSTPTLLGGSRIDGLFKAGDQRFWHLPCPGCGDLIVLEFKHLKFNRKPPYEAHYVAPCCGRPIEHNEKPALVRAGRFVATNQEGLYPSFHVDALISLVTTWDALAEAWWRAHGHERKERAFFNSWLGLPYELRGDAPDHERLMERREPYPENKIPPRGLLLVAGADVQHSGIWVEVVAFASDRQSWCVTRRFLEGDTTDPSRGAFAKLDEFYQETFEDAYGKCRRLDAMAVDAGDGGRANEVYAWTRLRPNALAVRGVGGWTAPAIGTPSKVSINARGKKLKRGSAELWPIGTWSLKAEFYANLRKPGKRAGHEADPPGYCHFGDWLDEPYFKQITAEYLADVTRMGRARKEWKQSGPNHLLDCRVYAMGMAEKLGLTTRTQEQWARLAKRHGVPDEAMTPDLFAFDDSVTLPEPKPRRARRVLSKGI